MEKCKELLRRALADECVYISQVREAFSDCGHSNILLRRRGIDGSISEHTIPLPADFGGEEFVCSYICAEIFNIMSALSAVSLELYIPGEDSRCRQLLEKCLARFESVKGYKKVINIAKRLCKSFGGGEFTVKILPASEYKSPATKTAAEQRDFPAMLAAAEKKAQKGFYCGIDIGGTDIKLATALDGVLERVEVLDWNPAESKTADEIINPVIDMLTTAADGRLFDGVGVSFPDVVIRNIIIGGETPKTKGMRENPQLDYESEFARLGRLGAEIQKLCTEGAPVKIINDGHMAAFTAAMEMTAAGNSAALKDGIIAFAIGTDLGTGVLDENGFIPEAPCELYDFLADMGSEVSRGLDENDIRCVRNENSGLNGARRYIGQASAFRYAMKYCPQLLEGFTEEKDGVLGIITNPDMRKPCLEKLMLSASEGNTAAGEIFVSVGRSFGVIIGEMQRIMNRKAEIYYVFGRFAKHPACFELMRRGCAETAPGAVLAAADESMAYTPLMKQLAAREGVSVAQYGQAVGSIYYALT